MKIDPSRTRGLEQGQQVQQISKDARVASEQTSQGGSDRVSISAQAQDFALARTVLEDDNALRAERVANLKSQIENGTYSVSTEAVASSFLKAIND